jgi:Na+/melibiose symporter-like transporter
MSNYEVFMKTMIDKYKKSRILYIIEAAIEHFISILIAESYLAKIATSAGLPDTLTHILSSFVSLACSFQMVAIFLASRRPVKRWVTPLHILNQTLFALLYLIPGIDLSTEIKGLIFIVFLLVGHIISQVVYSSKINWFMSMVDDNKRGRFTANKEIVSLMGGMVFSFVMGRIIDRFEASGNLDGAFTVIAVTIFVLMLGHTATLVFSYEKPAEQAPTPIKKELGALFRNKTLFFVIGVAVLWSITNYCITPFLGTYRNNVLGFSMTYNALLTAMYSIVRSLFSRPLGKLADKKSFAVMLTVCFGIQALGFAINIFTVPENGHILFAIYYMLHGIAMAGINSGAINLIYDYVEPDQRTGALAIRGTLAGLVGFATTLIFSGPVARITENGNMLFGIPVYAQQVMSAVALVLTLILILYLNLVVKKLKRK